jgi:hypothetical protein
MIQADVSARKYQGLMSTVLFGHAFFLRRRCSSRALSADPPDGRRVVPLGGPASRSGSYQPPSGDSCAPGLGDPRDHSK